MTSFYLFSVKLPSGQGMLCPIAKRTVKTQNKGKKIWIRSHFVQKKRGRNSLPSRHLKTQSGSHLIPRSWPDTMTGGSIAHFDEQHLLGSWYRENLREVRRWQGWQSCEKLTEKLLSANRCWLTTISEPRELQSQHPLKNGLQCANRLILCQLGEGGVTILGAESDVPARKGICTSRNKAIMLMSIFMRLV